VNRSDESGGLLSGVAPLSRRQLLRGIAVGGAAVGAGSLLAACSSSGSTTASTAATPTAPAKRGGSLKVGLSGSSGEDTLDPHNPLTFLDSARAQALYQSLAQLNGAGQLVNVLAENIYAKTPKEWIIELRKGVTFHSGKTLKAEDVIYTFRRILTGNTGGTSFGGGASLGPMDAAGLKALDDYTVQVPFSAPYAAFSDHLAFWYYLYIIPNGFNPAAKGAIPDGTGPFKYKSFTQNQQSVFVRNPDYWVTGQPYVDSVTILDFADNVSLQDALSTGTIDAAGGFDGPQLSALGSVSGVKTLASHTGAITPFTMRLDKAPFNNVNVRQALRYLVNRPQLIDSALDGYGTVASDVFSPLDPDFDHALTRQQDIPLAKSLLKKAGYDGDLKLTLVTSGASTGMVAMATVLAEQAQAAGVTITLNNVATSKFFGPEYLSWPFSQDFYSYNLYLPQVSTSFLGKSSPFNETHTNSPTINSLYAQANNTLSKPLRKEIEFEMQKYDFDNGGYIIPAFIDSLDAYSTKLTGYSPGAVGVPLSNFDFEKWSFV
jgi:peptide/nickel transport system substrate-binding protein